MRYCEVKIGLAMEGFSREFSSNLLYLPVREGLASIATWFITTLFVGKILLAEFQLYLNPDVYNRYVQRWTFLTMLIQHCDIIFIQAALHWHGGHLSLVCWRFASGLVCCAFFVHVCWSFEILWIGYIDLPLRAQTESEENAIGVFEKDRFKWCTKTPLKISLERW